MNNWITLVVGMIFTGWVVGTAAEQKGIIDAQTIEKALTVQPREGNDQEIVTRGFVPVAGPGRIDLTVEFKFDSAELTTSAAKQLDQLAIAMKSETLRTDHFDVIGHTDATGSDAYNMDLSIRRATSVQAYLVKRHGIKPERLTSQGKGEHELRDQAHPDSGVNRRVEIVNLRAGQ